MNCEQKIGDKKLGEKCGVEAKDKDTHGRFLCADHFAKWQRKYLHGVATGKMVSSSLNNKDLKPLDDLLHYLETDTGTIDQIVPCINGCRDLLKKIRKER